MIIVVHDYRLLKSAQRMLVLNLSTSRLHLPSPSNPYNTAVHGLLFSTRLLNRFTGYKTRGEQFEQDRKEYGEAAGRDYGTAPRGLIRLPRDETTRCLVEERGSAALQLS